MNFEQVINALTEQVTLKAALAVLGGWVLSLFLPILKFIILLIMLLSSDFVTGMLASRKEGKAITSKRMSGTVVKFVVYSLGILLAHFLQLAFQAENILLGFPFTYWVAFFICLTELKSNFENIERITGVKLVSLLNVFKLVKNKQKQNERNK